MDDETFFCGKYNAEEGGPKGIEILPEHQIAVITSICQPLAVFGLDFFGVTENKVDQGITHEYYQDPALEVTTLFRRVARRAQMLKREEAKLSDVRRKIAAQQAKWEEEDRLRAQAEANTSI